MLVLSASFQLEVATKFNKELLEIHLLSRFKGKEYDLRIWSKAKAVASNAGQADLDKLPILANSVLKSMSFIAENPLDDYGFGLIGRPNVEVMMKQTGIHYVPLGNKGIRDGLMWCYSCFDRGYLKPSNENQGSPRPPASLGGSYYSKTIPRGYKTSKAKYRRSKKLKLVIVTKKKGRHKIYVVDYPNHTLNQKFSSFFEILRDYFDQNNEVVVRLLRVPNSDVKIIVSHLCVIYHVTHVYYLTSSVRRNRLSDRGLSRDDDIGPSVEILWLFLFLALTIKFKEFLYEPPPSGL